MRAVASGATRQEGSDECLDLLGDALRAEGVADHRPGSHEMWFRPAALSRLDAVMARPEGFEPPTL